MKRNKVDEEVLDDFRSDLEKVVEEFIKNDRVEIFGNLRIEVANMDALALIKGNAIYACMQIQFTLTFNEIQKLLALTKPKKPRPKDN